MTNCGKTLGRAQNMLKRLCLLVGLGTPRDSPEGVGRSGWGEESLGFPPKGRDPDKWRKKQNNV